VLELNSCPVVHLTIKVMNTATSVELN